MNRMRWAAVLGVAMAWCVVAWAQPKPLDFEGASWIWYMAAPEAAARYPAGAIYCRGVVTLPEDAAVESAELLITADNLYTFYLNGKPAGESGTNPNEWNRPKRFDVADLLVPGRNVLAVEAINTAPGPAGLIVKLAAVVAGRKHVVLVTDDKWKCSQREVDNWHQPAFDDKAWAAPHVLGEFGVRPWGRFAVRAPLEPAGASDDAARQRVRQVLREHKTAAREIARAGTAPTEIRPPADYAWPEAVVFLGDDCSLDRPYQHTQKATDSLSVTVFNARKSRAFPEHDLPAPIKVGHKLLVLKPARPGVKPRVLLDAGQGLIGSPSVSFDGKSIYVAMVRQGDAFYHIYRLPAEGGAARQMTTGPFHDIDPAELPDGRIAFTSTRIGTFEEYHNPPSRSLFVMQADGSDARPLTNTFIFDNEPEVMADGRILMLRSDNFFDRGKVETMLHAIHPDGTEGYTEFGLDNGPEYGGRLRAFLCGSPAPMPDGRVAFLSGPGITVARPGSALTDWRHYRVEAGDVAALPDGRLLCTLAKRVPIEVTPRGKNKNKPGTQTVNDFSYEKIAVLDSSGKEDTLAVLFESSEGMIHSAVYLGARPRPPVLPEKVDAKRLDDVHATGFLFCQNARLTKNTTAGWPHVRAIRVLAGKGLTTRSSHSYIVHAGSDVSELGTVPLAPDGSFSIEVPADTAIAFQAVDAEGRSELNEMSWIYVRPGERRGCVGCHQTRQGTPICNGGLPMAVGARPLKLLPGAWPHRFRGNNAAVTGLMEMQFDRYREVAGINRHSETPDPSATGAQEVAALAAQLHVAQPPSAVPGASAQPGAAVLPAPDAGLRLSSIQRLGIFRDPAAAPALAGCLTDSNREIRVAAAVALAACGTRASMAPLLSALDDDDPLVRQAAAMALENLSGQARPFDAFADEHRRQAQAEQWRAWFKENDWTAVEKALLARLAEGDRDQQRRAAVALGHVGADAARTALAQYVTRHRDANPYPEWRKQPHSRGDGAKFNALSELNPRTLQAATRSLGYLKAASSVPMLAETIKRFHDPDSGNLFLAEAAVEALGRIATPEAEAALIAALAELKDYPRYTSWYGDHGALMACHASPVHYFIAEALDAMGSTKAAPIVPHLIRSVPTDVDRALLLQTDDCEAIFGRVIRRSGGEAAVVETCLAILGDAHGSRTKEIEDAIGATHQAWGGKPDPENRAAHTLSLVCRDRKYEPRLRAAFERYANRPPEKIPRVFDVGIPVVQQLPVKHWVCFFLARTLGNLGDPRSFDALLTTLAKSPTEAAPGRPDPAGPGVLFLHNDLTPCWRAATAWALGRLADRRAVPTLLAVIGNLDNATDTRHAAAEALGRIADPASRAAMLRLASDYPEFSVRRTLLRACDGLSAQVADGRSL